MRRYIRSQPEHHAKVSFQEELVTMLRKNRIEFEERFLNG
jgi:nicotinamide riboside kinase